MENICENGARGQDQIHGEAQKRKEGKGGVMQKLSVAWNNKKKPRYAKCPGCGAIYIDDVQAFGSLHSPCCPEFCMIRGVAKEEVGRG
jgi:hypothetical protein